MSGPGKFQGTRYNPIGKSHLTVQEPIFLLGLCKWAQSQADQILEVWEEPSRLVQI